MGSQKLPIVCNYLACRQNTAASAGRIIMAPNIFTTNMKVSRIPMSIWNLSAEKNQVLTPIANVRPVNITALPRSTNAS